TLLLVLLRLHMRTRSLRSTDYHAHSIQTRACILSASPQISISQICGWARTSMVTSRSWASVMAASLTSVLIQDFIIHLSYITSENLTRHSLTTCHPCGRVG